MGAGFVAASLLGSLAGQPAAAYQATFNLQTPNVTGQTSRTFTDGTPTDHTMVMTVGSKTSIDGTSLNVSTSTISGLCVIRDSCPSISNGVTMAATFSFSKPVELGLYNNFKVGRNGGPWETDLGLALFYNGLQQGSTISLNDPILTTGSNFNFGSKVLVAANTAITVGLICSTSSCTLDAQDFYISDVIVEAPAPLPLIGTGAAFAWTRRLRRRIKGTPSPISKG
jgi:hypothetical protein